MRIKILDRYLIGEMVIPFIIGVVGFILIMIVDILFTLADLIINKGIPAVAVLKLLIFKLPAIMVLTFPVSILFATAMVMGRLCKDSEMVAFRTSGITFIRIALPIIFVAVLISGLSFLTNEKVVPWANHVSENIIRQIILKKPLPQVRENVFFKGSNDRYFYVRKMNVKRGMLEGIMIYEFLGEKLPRVIIAKRAKFDGTMWQLEDGIVHKYDSRGRMTYEADFGRMSIYVEEDIFRFSNQKTTQEMNSAELKSLIKMLGRGGVSTRSLMVDLYMKYSVPLTCLIFALIGIPLSVSPVRSGRMFGIVLSIVIVFSFYVFASVFRSLGYGGKLVPFISAWFPQISFGILGSILIARESFFR